MFPFRRLTVTAIFLCALLMVSCQSKTGNEQSAGRGNRVTGAGSTFVYPLMSRWVSEFQAKNPGVQINYQSIGSGGGIQQLSKGLVQFAASDMPLDKTKAQQMGNPVQISESAGPVVVTYNLPGLKQPLQLTPEALAGIFLGNIKNWQDATIKKANPGVDLPQQDIAVIHRSDGSGTTNIFTTYLSSVSPQWKEKVGQGLSVSWPVGLGGKGSEGVTGLVKQTPGAIGYVELTYAETNHLPAALVQNQAKEFIKPTAAATTAAIAAFADQLSKDITVPIVNPPASAKEAYPISGLTFLLIPQGTAGDPAKQNTVKEFVRYIITDGQAAAEKLNYAPLPQELRDLNMKLLAQLGSS